MSNTGIVVIVEKIFNINGMGLMMWDAVLKRDYYVVMAVTTISASLVLLSLVLVDVVAVGADPTATTTNSTTAVLCGRKG